MDGLLMAHILETKLDLDDIVRSSNVCAKFEDDDCEHIAGYAKEGYDNDVQSRSEWEKRQARANMLALQVYEEKTWPWPHASSVKFPLITVAAMQYHAKSYAALVSGTDLVKSRIFGEDADGAKASRAQRVSGHMSWQNLEQDDAWEEQTDKLLLVQPIAGCAFRKRVFEPGPGRQVSMLVLPEDFVINYNAKSINDAPRYTHRFNLSHNNIRQREMDQRFREPKTEITPILAVTNEIAAAREKREGVEPTPVDSATPFLTAEQACWMDLDHDGYEEPYLVTFDIGSGQLRRIVARFLPSGIKERQGNIYKKGGSVYKITPVPMFVKYPFIPSPDGGFYDLGLGSLLGPINESINTSINQMHDQATMASRGGGFLGRGFKGKGGPITFDPNQWHQVDASGDDLRKQILPLPVREPSVVLFQLLGLLLQYGERVVSANDIQMGENIGQNTPAETARTMNENGARIYNGIYKRTWRAERDEFRVQYELNKLFLQDDTRFDDLTSGKTALVRADDYLGSDIDIRPAADPHIVSDGEAVKQATALVQLAESRPGYNKYQAHRRLVKAMKVSNPEEVLPPPMEQGPNGQPQPAKDFPPMPNPKMIHAQVEQADQQLRQKQFMSDQMELKINLQMELEHSTAEINKFNAQATKLLAEAKGAEVEPQIKLIYAQIEAEGKHRDHIMKLIEIMGKGMEKANGADGAKPAMAEGQSGGASALGAVPKSNGAGAPGAMGGQSL
jgi:chaperonin GroES